MLSIFWTNWCHYTDALGLEDLKLVLIDASHIDQKQRGILDIKETQKSLMDLLNYTTLKRKLVEGDVRLLFF